MRVLSSVELGKEIQKKRKCMKLTQKELAMYCNTGVRFISDLENGKSTCEIQKVLDVVSMLGMNVFLENRK